MADVVKVIELVGESTKDWTDAVNNAVAEACRTLDHVSGVEVCNLTANVDASRPMNSPLMPSTVHIPRPSAATAGSG